MKKYSSSDDTQLDTIFTQKEVLDIKNKIDEVTVSDAIYDYIVDLVLLTRDKTFSDKYLAV
jgi:hypothetical protein